MAPPVLEGCTLPKDAIRAAPSPLRQRQRQASSHVPALRDDAESRLQRHKERLLGLRSEAAEASAAALEALEAALGAERSREASSSSGAVLPKAMTHAASGLTEGSFCLKLPSSARRSLLRPMLAAWRLLICWAAAERRTSTMRHVLCEVQQRALRLLLQREQQRRWQLLWHLWVAWRVASARSATWHLRQSRHVGGLEAMQKAQGAHRARSRAWRAWACWAARASAARTSRCYAAECHSAEALTARARDVLQAWAAAARARKASPEACAAEFQASSSLAARAVAAWAAVAAREAACRALQRADERTAEAAIAMGAAESRLLEVAGAESRLSRARSEVLAQVEALRAAVAAGAPAMALQRALLAWRAAVALGASERFAPPMLSPSSPRMPPPTLRRPALQLKSFSPSSSSKLGIYLSRSLAREQRWCLAAVLGAWSKAARPVQRATDMLRAQATLRVESAKRTMEAAEKAVLLACVFKAWADWAGSEQAKRWLELLQAEGRMSPSRADPAKAEHEKLRQPCETARKGPQRGC